MKLNKETLKRIIKEELESSLFEMKMIRNPETIGSMKQNPWGGRYYYEFDPDPTDPNKGHVTLFYFNPLTDEIEFANAFYTEDFIEEMRLIRRRERYNQQRGIFFQ